MYQERQAKLLANETEEIISSLVTETGFYLLVKEALVKARKASTTKTAYSKPWPILPLMVCEAISEHYDHAIPAAVALELLKAAAEVFDDTEDTDSSESIQARYGTAEAVNIATTLFVLAEKAIARLTTRGVANHIIIRVFDVVNSLCSNACIGQHLDFSISPNIVTEEMYLKIAGMKSASQIECVCHVGALLATEDEELVEKFALFGYNLGLASQIANDIQGITRGSDILKRKITLPIIYALSHTNSQDHIQIKAIFNKSSNSVPDPKKISNILLQIGAIHYAIVKLEFYKQKAQDILSYAKKKGANVESLKIFFK